MKPDQAMYNVVDFLDELSDKGRPLIEEDKARFQLLLYKVVNNWLDSTLIDSKKNSIQANHDFVS